MAAEMSSTGRRGGVTILQVLRLVLVLVVMGGVLFGAAGRLDWVMGWIFVASMFINTAVSRLLIARKYPDLITERAGSLEKQDAKAWDRTIVPIVAIYGPLVILIVAGLNRRFGWPPEIPLWLQIVGLAVATVGTYFGTWAMLVNRFFSGVVRIQTDRGHTVVDSGPYRIVRHPAYLGSLVTWVGTAFMLGSPWTLIPAALIAVLTVVRTALEDRTLIAELPGYAEYTQRTRYRLLPGIW